MRTQAYDVSAMAVNPMQGAHQLEADANCARWLHLVNLQHLRQDPEAAKETVARLPEEWFWPLKTGDM